MITTELIAQATQEAQAAADAAQVSVAWVDDLPTLTGVEHLVNETWAIPGATETNLGWLRAITTSGGYVSAATRDGEVIGSCVGFFGPPAAAVLHSHLAAVSHRLRSGGVGLALKMHQRAWALTQGVPVVQWTYDPLSRRNLLFNLVRLGARPTAYLDNHYGVLGDQMNGDLPTDRVLVQWDLASAHPGEAASDGVVVLSEGADGMPQRLAEVAPGRLVIGTPSDVIGLRRERPSAALAWRAALAETLGAAVHGGGSVVGATTDGSYVVEL